MSQETFGYAIGSSHRSAVRWDAGQATPAAAHLHTLARLLYPQNRALAAEVADAADETLESLGLEAPPPASPPSAVAPAAPRAEDLVDVLVLKAVEISESPPASMRPLLHAVFQRGCEVGLTMQAAERALRPPAAAQDEGMEGGKARASAKKRRAEG